MARPHFCVVSVMFTMIRIKFSKPGHFLNIFALDFLHRHQGNEAKNGTPNKWNPIINHPKSTPYCRQNHRCNVVYGETD